MSGLRARLAAGGPSYGVWCTFVDVLVAETLAAAGVDWVLLDQQHGGLAGPG
jgi:2-keto-3-deoxy-L-rhamnonate aldolase RhmA